MSYWLEAIANIISGLAYWEAVELLLWRWASKYVVASVGYLIMSDRVPTVLL
jgi:hypothetical protein